MVLEMMESQLNLSAGEFQSLTGQLDDVNCVMVVIDKLVGLQVCPAYHGSWIDHRVCYIGLFVGNMIRHPAELDICECSF